MSARHNPKARGDSKLKTLPEARQAEIYDYLVSHTGKDTKAWLHADGLDTSTGALSGFRVWYE